MGADGDLGGDAEVVLDASVINIALAHAQAALDISDANRRWAVTAYALTFGGLLLLGGRVVDLVGRKRVTGFLADRTGAVSQAVRLDGYVHGHRVAFLAGAALFALALAATGLLIRSRRTHTATS